MFALTSEDLARRTIGCGDGPASLNAVSARNGGRVVSCDPIYRFDAGQIAERIAATSDNILEQVRRNIGDYVWGEGIRTVEGLGQVRRVAMQAFLDDFPAGGREGRYVAAALPQLPFADAAFEIGLCSPFLFLYSEQLGEAFHRAAVRELCRVACEVRVFPLVVLDGSLSPFVAVCRRDLEAAGLHVSVEGVPYEFRRGAN